MSDTAHVRGRSSPTLVGHHELAGAVDVTPLQPVPEGRASRQTIIENAHRRLTEAR